MFSQILAIAILVTTAVQGGIHFGYSSGIGDNHGLSGDSFEGHGDDGLGKHDAQLSLQSGDEHHYDHEHDYHAHPKYKFKYGVSDGHTGDNKQHYEERDGDVVKGEYTVYEPDGTIRTVKYTADHKNGFVAHVTRSGNAIHPQVHHHEEESHKE